MIDVKINIEQNKLRPIGALFAFFAWNGVILNIYSKYYVRSECCWLATGWIKSVWKTRSQQLHAHLTHLWFIHRAKFQPIFGKSTPLWYWMDHNVIHSAKWCPFWVVAQVIRQIKIVFNRLISTSLWWCIRATDGGFCLTADGWAPLFSLANWNAFSIELCAFLFLGLCVTIERDLTPSGVVFLYCFYFVRLPFAVRG